MYDLIFWLRKLILFSCGLQIYIPAEQKQGDLSQNGTNLVNAKQELESLKIMRKILTGICRISRESRVFLFYLNTEVYCFSEKSTCL